MTSFSTLRKTRRRYGLACSACRPYSGSAASDSPHDIRKSRDSGRTRIWQDADPAPCAQYLWETYGIRRERFSIFVYTSILKNYIKSALHELGLPERNVLTFDNWCCGFYQKHIDVRLPLEDERNGVTGLKTVHRTVMDNPTSVKRACKKRVTDLKTVRRAVMDHAISRKMCLFDFVLVDEGQDFEEEVFSFLTKISRHSTVCLDRKQQVYDVASTEEGILRALGIRRRDVSLIDAFRVCPYLVEVAAKLIREPAEREAFRNQARQQQTERETPLVYFAQDLLDERRMLCEIVRERQLRNDRIAILLPQKAQILPFAKSLGEVGLEVEVPDRNELFPTHDFNSLRPKLLNYHGAKGLSFDSVMIPRLISGCFRGYLGSMTPQRIERLLFVAVTRATKWCYFSAESAKPLQLLKQKLVPLARSRLLTVIYASRLRTPPSSPPRLSDPDRSNDLDFL